MHYLLKNQSDIDNIRETTGLSISIITDNGLSVCITKAENWVFEKVGPFYSTEVTEIFDGDGSTSLILSNVPVLSVSKVEIDDIEIDSDGYYWYENGKIILDDTDFTLDCQNVEITYTYGITETKFPRKYRLAQDLATWVAIKIALIEGANIQSSGIQSEKYDINTITYDGMPFRQQLLKIDQEIESIIDILGIKLVYGVI